MRSDTVAPRCYGVIEDSIDSETIRDNKHRMAKMNPAISIALYLSMRAGLTE